MPEINRTRTEWGFHFGAAEVSAICCDDAKGWTLIGVESPKSKLQIYTTRTGKIRVFKDGKELFPKETK